MSSVGNKSHFTDFLTIRALSTLTCGQFNGMLLSDFCTDCTKRTRFVAIHEREYLAITARQIRMSFMVQKRNQLLAHLMKFRSFTWIEYAVGDPPKVVPTSIANTNLRDDPAYGSCET